MSSEDAVELGTLSYEDPIKKNSVSPTVRPLSIDAGISPGAVLGGIGKDDGGEAGSRRPSLVAPSIKAQQNWNDSKLNVFRTFSTFWCFLVMGMNDAAYGPLIPYLEKYYSLNYTIISLGFLSPFVGSTVAALSNNAIHVHFGQRGIASISSITKLVVYIILAVHPPYPVVVVMFGFAGFANALEDAGWNAWIGDMANANEVLGFLHGFYGLGGVLSPLIATTMITKANLQWYTFYYVMIGAISLDLVILCSAFWRNNGAVFRQEHPVATTPETNKSNNTMKESLFTMPSARVTWSISCITFAYVGTEVALGGWIVTFMINVRHSSPFASGMTATGFWLGITVGRVILGFVTGRIGEKLAMTIYLLLSLIFELLFWLVPHFYVSAVAVSLQGFFIGPLFPAAVVVATKLLPKHLHVSAIGFACSIGGCGAAVFPFAVGAIAQKAGVKVLQPFILALLAAMLCVWVTLPRLPRRGREKKS